MHFLDAIVLGVVEGVTEFLPISSTGHLILTGTLLGIPNTDALKIFEIVIQVGAIAAVLALYWKSFLNLDLLKKLFVAFLPTGIIGLTVYPFFKTALSGNMEVVIWSLFVGGVVLMVAEKIYPSAVRVGNVEALSYGDCIALGLCQAIAIIPGVSRSGATIVGGRLMGVAQSTIVEFSFLLAVPTMVVASGYELVKNRHLLTSSDIGMMAVGTLVSFVVALIVIKWFLTYIRTHSFAAFGAYRIVVAGIVAWFVRV